MNSKETGMQSNRFIRLLVTVTGSLLLCLLLLSPVLALDKNSVSTSRLVVPLVVDPVPNYNHVLPAKPVSELSKAAVMASTFVINYLPAGSDPYDIGDTCTTWPDEAKTSFETAVSVWSTRVISSVPITIDACWATNLPTGVLGHAGSLSEYQNFTNAPLPNTFYKVALANALAGSKLNVGQSDMYIAYSSTFDWYYSADGNTPSDKIDFITVVAHEVAHGLGFAGGMTVSSGTGSYSKIFAYDRFAYNGSSQALLNTTIFPNPSTALGTVLTSNNVWFSGTKANIANNNTDVKLYAPTTWAPGSSYSHLDYTTFVNTSNAMMVFAVSYGRAIHDPGVVTLGLLEDLGWTTAATPTYTLTVTKNGTGSGTVTSAPAGISCGSTCSASFLAPTSITLTAAGDTSSGSIFTGWSGGGCSGTGTCVVNLTDNTSVTATFATTTLGEALNIPGITITTSSNANWFPESSTSHDGISAAQSGDISDSQSSFMEFTVHGPGLLSFWWKVSSESGWDFLKFYIDGVPQNIDISGDVDWTQVSGINIPSGSHTLRWTYSKDGSASNGSDAGWVDEIFMEHTLDVFIDGAGSGNVASSPSGINCSSGGCAVNYNLGTLVTLMATPSGSSTFGGWSGCTTPVGTICNIIMNERKSVTATFNAPNKVKILNGSSYATIADAYAAANAGATIMLAQDTFNSDLTLDLNKAVTLSGGWYPDFHGLTGLYSYLQGVLTIANGSLTVENLIVK